MSGLFIPTSRWVADSTQLDDQSFIVISTPQPSFMRTAQSRVYTPRSTHYQPNPTMIVIDPYLRLLSFSLRPFLIVLSLVSVRPHPCYHAPPPLLVLVLHIHRRSPTFKALCCDIVDTVGGSLLIAVCGCNVILFSDSIRVVRSEVVLVVGV